MAPARRLGLGQDVIGLLSTGKLGMSSSREMDLFVHSLRQADCRILGKHVAMVGDAVLALNENPVGK